MSLIATEAGILSPQLRSFHADTLNALNWLSTQGEWLSIEHEAALDRHIRDLHGEGNPFYSTRNIWSKLRAAYPMIGSTAISHSLNIINNALPLTFGGTVTHSANGAFFNVGYGDVGFNMTSQPINAGAGYYGRNDYRPVGVNAFLGLAGGGGGDDGEFAIFYNSGANEMNHAIYNFNVGNVRVNPSYSTASYMSMSRISDVDHRAYRNGVQVGATLTTPLGASVAAPFNVFIGAFNSAGAMSLPSVTECAYAQINYGLTPEEEAFYYQSIRELQISLDRANIAEEGIDADATAFANAVTANGGHINVRELLAVSKLITDFKANGTWATKFAIYPFVGNNALAHCINLRNPATHKLTFSGNIMCSKNGTIFDGVSGVALTDINSLVEFPNSGHISFYSRTRTRDKVYIPIIGGTVEPGPGGVGPDGVLLIIQNPDGTTASCWGQNAFTMNVNVAGVRPDGWWVSSRNGNNQFIHSNGRQMLGKNFATGPHTTIPLLIGGINNNGALTPSGTFRECSYSDFGLNQASLLVQDTIAIERMQYTLERAIYDADVRVFVQQIVVNGGTMTEAQWDTLHDIVLEMKRTGIWWKMTAIYPMVGGNAACHALNLINPAIHSLTFVGGMTHSATGVLFDGTSGYAHTDFNAVGRVAYGAGYYSRINYTGATHVMVGAFDSAGKLFEIAYAPGLGMLYDQYDINNGRTIDASSGTLGFLSTSRLTSSNQTSHLNGVLRITNNTPITSTSPAMVFHLGSISTDAEATHVVYSPTECAWADFHTGLTPVEELIRYNLVQAFQIASARQV